MSNQYITTNMLCWYCWYVVGSTSPDNSYAIRNFYTNLLWPICYNLSSTAPQKLRNQYQVMTAVLNLQYVVNKTYSYSHVIGGPSGRNMLNALRVSMCACTLHGHPNARTWRQAFCWSRLSEASFFFASDLFSFRRCSRVEPTLLFVQAPQMLSAWQILFFQNNRRCPSGILGVV